MGSSFCHGALPHVYGGGDFRTTAVFCPGDIEASFVALCGTGCSVQDATVLGRHGAGLYFWPTQWEWHLGEDQVC